MKFFYKARTKEGKTKEGEIDASSKEVAALLLRKYDLFPTSIEQAQERSILKRFRPRKKISKKDLSAFSSQVSVMLSSRVSPTEALLAIASQTENEDFRRVIIESSEIVEKGLSFSEAFSYFPDYFNDFYINILKSGESTGRISDSFKKLAGHLEKEYDLASKIKGALVYPALVLFVTVVVVFIVIFWVMPAIADILGGDLEQVSFLAKLLFNLSGFLKKWGIVLILLLMGAIIFLVYYFRTEEGKRAWDRNSIKLPVFGDFFKKIYLSRFAEAFSALLSAGLPINQSLKITSNMIGNSVYKNLILEAEKEISKGENINSVLIKEPELIPPFVVQMIRTGEVTGKLDETLLEIVKFYQKEIQITTDTFLTILEPILVIIVGMVVALVGSAVFSAIYGTMKMLY